MNSDIKIQLKEAKKLYDSHKYEESLKLYKQLFDENQDQFRRNDLISYCWAIYQVRVKNFKDEDELFDAAEFITEIVPQDDLNYRNTCPYAFSVLKVLDYLHDENQYYNMSYWFDKLNPRLLDSARQKKNGRFKRSRKEKYYDYVSKSHLECADWGLCIEASKEALVSLKVFTNYGDTWHRWRIAKSLRQLNQCEDALKYLDEVVKVKNDWFIFREIAENYHTLNEDEKALKYIGEAILAEGSLNSKVNLFHLAYEALEDVNPDMAFRHIELFYLIKLETNAQIPEEVEDLDIDEDSLDKKELISQINDFWLEAKFEGCELQHGTVTKFMEDKNFGFITTDNFESIFFHKSEFNGDKIYVGEEVSFYTEKSFDKSKNKESVKAVCIRGE